MIERLKRYFVKSIIDGVPLIVFTIILQSLAIALMPRIATHAQAFFIVVIKLSWLAIAISLLSFEKRWIRLLWVTLSLLITEVYIYLGLRFSVSFTPYVAQLILQTSPGEATEFFSAYLNYKFVIALIAVFIIVISSYILSERLWHKLVLKRSTSWINRTKTILISTAIIFSISLLANLQIFKSINFSSKNANFYKELFCLIKPPISEMYISFNSGGDNKEVVARIINANHKIQVDSCTYKTPHIIVVIGESFIKSHSNLYGYRLNTNPLLKAELDSGRLFVFSDAVSEHMVTKSCIQSIHTVDNPDSGDDFTIFPSVFKKAGYTVSVIDNQVSSISREWEFSLLFLMKQPELSADCIDYCNERPKSFDHEIVIDERDRELSMMSHPTLSIYHLQGQHEDAYWRYPQVEKFQYFTPDSIRRDVPNKMDIVNYDNATRYNDYVLNEIIDTYRDVDAIVIYMSDHGDSMYDDDGDTYGRGLRPELTLQQIKLYFEVPFMIWCSDKCIENHPDMIASIKESINNPIVTGNIAHALFELAGISTNVYDHTQSFINADFSPKHRILHSQEITYDYEELKPQLDSVKLKSALN